jgi:hypothetical protein
MTRPSGRRRCVRRVLTRGLGATCVALDLAPLVFAFPQPWVGGTIRVFDQHTGWASELHQATDKWNEARVGIRFTYVASAARADVIVQVRPSPAAERAACHLPGTALVDACTDWVGRKPWGSALLMVVPPDGPGAVFDSALAAHEFGHVLGLLHRSGPGCLIMNPRDESCVSRLGRFSQGYPAGCAPGAGLAQRSRDCPVVTRVAAVCGPLAGDIGEARLIYHGPGNPRYSPLCWKDYMQASERDLQRQAMSWARHVHIVLAAPIARQARELIGSRGAGGIASGR